MEGDHIKLNYYLTPLAWLYGLCVWIRNILFEMNVLKSREFSIPVISVGNITVGGSGKTPTVEYLIDLLHYRVKTAVLSRGYKRKSKGFVLGTSHSDITDIGDEPYQMLMKYPDATVAVDANRCHGIEQLMTLPETKGIGVVLLDDAFQHRYVKPGINILLTDYHRIITDDRLLPVGRLREPVSGKDRADIVILTKCPRELKPMEYRVLVRNMNLFPFQRIYFSTLKYCPLNPMYLETKALRQPDFNIPLELQSVSAPTLKLPHILLLTGIASPKQLTEDLNPYCEGITHIQFADHHHFTASDAESINFAYKMLMVRLAQQQSARQAIIVTTEKDAMRLQHLEGLSKLVRENIYYLPIKIEFLLGEKEDFDKVILDYVLRKNQGNSGLAPGATLKPTSGSSNPGNRFGTARTGNRDLFGNPV